jgi:hypothetical protein
MGKAHSPREKKEEMKKRQAFCITLRTKGLRDLTGADRIVGMALRVYGKGVLWFSKPTSFSGGM